jgi:hypothetical protein
MPHRYSALAMSALAVGAVVLTTTEASAMLRDPGTWAAAAAVTADEWPDEGSGYPGFESKSPEHGYLDHDPQHHGNMTAPEGRYEEYNYPEYKFDVPSSPTGRAESSAGPVREPVSDADAALDPAPSDNTGVEGLQTGASALGGAGLAVGGLWLYRRLHARAA